MSQDQGRKGRAITMKNVKVSALTEINEEEDINDTMAKSQKLEVPSVFDKAV